MTLDLPWYGAKGQEVTLSLMRQNRSNRMLHHYHLKARLQMEGDRDGQCDGMELV